MLNGVIFTILNNDHLYLTSLMKICLRKYHTLVMRSYMFATRNVINRTKV